LSSDQLVFFFFQLLSERNPKPSDDLLALSACSCVVGGRSSASLFLVFVFVGLLLRWRPALVRFDFRRGVFGVPMLAFL